MEQHLRTRNARGYLLGRKSKAIEKCLVSDICMGASRLLGHTKKLETVYRAVTGRQVCNSQFHVAKYEILFGLDSESYIFHLSLCSSVLDFQTFQGVVLLFLLL